MDVASRSCIESLESALAAANVDECAQVEGGPRALSGRREQRCALLKVAPLRQLEHAVGNDGAAKKPHGRPGREAVVTAYGTATDTFAYAAVTRAAAATAAAATAIDST